MTDRVNLTEDVRWKLIELVYVGSRLLWTNVVLVAIVGCVGMLRFPSAWLVGWCVVGLFASGLRVHEFHEFPRIRHRLSADAAERRYMFGAWLVGLHWGTASCILILTEDSVLHFWFINSLSAFLALAVARCSPILLASEGLVFTTLTPVFLVCVFSRDPYMQAYSALAIIYIVSSLGIARFMHAQTVRLLVLDHTNAMLLHKVHKANSEIELANMELLTRANTDGLTGLSNRRSFDDALSAAVKKADDTKTGIALLVADVDHFKSYNDSFGHLAGDDCLRLVAASIRETIRETDFAARYGGEEFAVILPDTDLEQAAVIAERIRLRIERLSSSAGMPSRVVTVSIGIAATSGLAQPTDGLLLLAEADIELYRAKEDGRNRVSSSSSPPLLLSA